MEKQKQLDASRFHYLEPDYSRPVYEPPDSVTEKILSKLNFLYGEEKAAACFPELIRVLRVYYAYKTPGMIEWEK